MIHIDHLTKEFTPNVRVVDDISFHVREGEIFGFLGPNGAGKTTTIKILTTLLHATSGTVTVAGHDVFEDPLSVRMSFGYVGQQSGVDPALTVSENLILQGHLYHLKKRKIEERVTFLLDLFEMSGRGGQWVGSLSGGLKRRLDIATSLIHEPKLLFLDEPTLGLDPKSRADLWTYIRRLNKEHGVTVFLTTHYLDEVDQLADRVGILDEGRIRIIGTPDELKDSLGADTIQLTFTSSPSEETLKLFQKNTWFKEVIHQEKEVRLYLEDGRQKLPKVIQWLDEHQLSPQSVLLARPTFDDVYLKYTGKSFALSEEKSDDAWGSWGGSGAGKWKNKWKKDGEEGGEDNDTEDWKKWQEKGSNSEDDWQNQLENKESSPKESSPNEEGKGQWPAADRKSEAQWNANANKNPAEAENVEAKKWPENSEQSGENWESAWKNKEDNSKGDWQNKWQKKP